MFEFKRHTDLEVWKKSRELVSCIYTLSGNFPKEESYGLTNQMHRCAVSVPSNIAEGVGRNIAKDSIHFFFISKGSLYELETQLYLSFDLQYITENILNETLLKIHECLKLLNDFINYYKNKSITKLNSNH